jgi:hypothetical protein
VDRYDVVVDRHDVVVDRHDVVVDRHDVVVDRHEVLVGSPPPRSSPRIRGEGRRGDMGRREDMTPGSIYGNRCLHESTPA